VRSGLGRKISARLRFLYGAPRPHQVSHQLELPFRIELRIARPPGTFPRNVCSLQHWLQTFGGHMKKLLLSGAVVVLLTGSVFAQSVIVEPEQRTRIKEYVVKQNVPRVALKERVRIGTPVPADVELREVPEDWGPSVRRYRYYHSDSGVHFVEPESRRVIYDID
jgi:hypothetical protein